MYRYNTNANLASTPPNSGGRRSGRAVRGSVKRRRSDGSSRGGGGGGGLKRKFEQIAQTSAKKWVRVYRAPAPNITFKVPVWVPYANLTDEERWDYDAKKEGAVERRLQEQQGQESTTVPSSEKSKGHGMDSAEAPESCSVLPEPLMNPTQEALMEDLEQLDKAMDILEQEEEFLRISAVATEGEPDLKRTKIDDLPEESLEAAVFTDDQNQETIYHW